MEKYINSWSQIIWVVGVLSWEQITSCTNIHIKLHCHSDMKKSFCVNIYKCFVFEGVFMEKSSRLIWLILGIWNKNLLVSCLYKNSVVRPNSIVMNNSNYIHINWKSLFVRSIGPALYMRFLCVRKQEIISIIELAQKHILIFILLWIRICIYTHTLTPIH